MLREYEAAATALKTADVSAELQTLKDAYSIVGFPLNLANVGVPKMVEAVQLTRLHESNDPSVEFALAAHVWPFPNGVFAVWVYVAELRRIR